MTEDRTSLFHLPMSSQAYEEIGLLEMIFSQQPLLLRGTLASLSLWRWLFLLLGTSGSCAMGNFFSRSALHLANGSVILFMTFLFLGIELKLNIRMLS